MFTLKRPLVCLLSGRLDKNPFTLMVPENPTLQGHGYLSDGHNDKAALPVENRAEDAAVPDREKVSRMLVVWKR